TLRTKPRHSPKPAETKARAGLLAIAAAQEVARLVASLLLHVVRLVRIAPPHERRGRIIEAAAAAMTDARVGHSRLEPGRELRRSGCVRRRLPHPRPRGHPP